MMRWVELLVAAIAGLILTAVVHVRAGDEVALCDGAAGTECAIGSGISWLLTGVLLVAPLIAVLGFSWTRHNEATGRLGPFVRSTIPDWEEQIEAAGVVVAGLLSFLIIRRGPKTPMVGSTWFNSWLADHLGTEAGAPLVPSRMSWFVIGVLIGIPFAFSLGSAIGREWYSWRRRHNDEVEVDEASP